MVALDQQLWGNCRVCRVLLCFENSQVWEIILFFNHISNANVLSFKGWLQKWSTIAGGIRISGISGRRISVRVFVIGLFVSADTSQNWTRRYFLVKLQSAIQFIMLERNVIIFFSHPRRWRPTSVRYTSRSSRSGSSRCTLRSATGPPSGPGPSSFSATTAARSSLPSRSQRSPQILEFEFFPQIFL